MVVLGRQLPGSTPARSIGSNPDDAYAHPAAVAAKDVEQRRRAVESDGPTLDRQWQRGTAHRRQDPQREMLDVHFEGGAKGHGPDVAKVLGQHREIGDIASRSPPSPNIETDALQFLPAPRLFPLSVPFPCERAAKVAQDRCQRRRAAWRTLTGRDGNLDLVDRR